MKTITLTQGFEAIVDDEDYEVLNGFKWHISMSARSKYAMRYSPKERKKIYMHRQIMSTPRGMLTDHVNKNTMDNRKINLRVCTRSKNQMNRDRCKNNTLFKGVWKQGSRYMARIRYNGVIKYLGMFVLAEDAARAYNKAAQEYHGEFASMNPVEAREGELCQF